MEESRTKSLANRIRLILLFLIVAHSSAWMHLSNSSKLQKGEVTKHTLAGVQRPHGTALIACHLAEHKPPVGSRMTLWRETTGHQRHTPAKPSKVYPEERGHMLFHDRQSMQ